MISFLFLLGTAFNIAYWHRKYHSGTICKGVSNPQTSKALSGCEKEDTKKEKEGFQFLILIVRGSFYLLEAFPDLYRFSLPSLFPLVIISLNLLWLFLVRSYRARQHIL